MRWPPVSGPEHDSELDALCRSSWGDVPWIQIPENWRNVDPPKIAEMRRRRGERGPDKNPPKNPLWHKNFDQRAAELKQRMLAERASRSKRKA